MPADGAARKGCPCGCAPRRRRPFLPLPLRQCWRRWRGAHRQWSAAQLLRRSGGAARWRPPTPGGGTRRWSPPPRSWPAPQGGGGGPWQHGSSIGGVVRGIEAAAAAATQAGCRRNAGLQSPPFQPHTNPHHTHRINPHLTPTHPPPPTHFHLDGRQLGPGGMPPRVERHQQVGPRQVDHALGCSSSGSGSVQRRQWRQQNTAAQRCARQGRAGSQLRNAKTDELLLSQGGGGSAGEVAANCCWLDGFLCRKLSHVPVLNVVTGSTMVQSPSQGCRQTGRQAGRQAGRQSGASFK